MQLQHIELGKLAVSAANMRSGKKPPELDDILPSVRARGILVPLLVRPKPCPDDQNPAPSGGRCGSVIVEGGGPDCFEIVAGRRRFFAAQKVAEESGLAEPLPCAVMEAGDDAAALEASLIENVARADPHEVEQWETFTRLVREGRKAQEIAATFGLTDLMVKQVLALGNLLPRIRDLYRREEIDAATVRLLTMATKSQQKDWLALLADPDSFTPMGHSLKSWLFGGTSISTNVALFDLATYPGTIVTDLFGEDGYFGDADAFWEAQMAAVEERRAAWLEDGWSEVVVLRPGEYFNSWEYEKVPKRKGGRIYVALSTRGEAAFHEGYLTRKEAERARKGGSGEDSAEPKPLRSEVTGTMQTYIDLHRHAAVRAALTRHPGVALRLVAAHAIHGSYLFSVRADPQRGGSNAVTESVETCAAETAFDEKRRAALASLDFDPDTPTVIGGAGYALGTAGLFLRLLALGDEEVLSILAVVMGEALESGSEMVEALGVHLAVDMAACWQPDDAFFDLNRDKEVLTFMVAEVAGEAVAKANAKEKAKAQKAIIRDCLAGANDRPKVEGWVPRWMVFPPCAYTARGGVGSVQRWNRIAGLFEPEPEPEGPQTAAEPQSGGEEQADAVSVGSEAERLLDAEEGVEPVADPELPAEAEREAA